MRYSLLLEKLAKYGFGQVSRMTTGSYDVAFIGRPSAVIYPHPFPNYPIILDGGPNSEIDPEIVDALLRWIAGIDADSELDPEDFRPTLN